MAIKSPFHHQTIAIQILREKQQKIVCTKIVTLFSSERLVLLMGTWEVGTVRQSVNCVLPVD